MRMLYFLIALLLLFCATLYAEFEYPLNIHLGMGEASCYSFHTQITAREHRDFPYPMFDLYFSGTVGLDYLYKNYEEFSDRAGGDYNRAIIYFVLGNFDEFKDFISLGLVSGVYYASFPGFESEDILFGIHLNADYSFLWEPDYFTTDWIFLIGNDYAVITGKISASIYKGFGFYGGFSYDGAFDHFSNGDYENSLLVHGGIEYNLTLRK